MYCNLESLRAIAETIGVGQEVGGLAAAPLRVCDRLARKSSMQPSWIRQTDCLPSSTPAHGSLPRNISETQLASFKTAGGVNVVLIQKHEIYFIVIIG